MNINDDYKEDQQEAKQIIVKENNNGIRGNYIKNWFKNIKTILVGMFIGAFIVGIIFLVIFLKVNNIKKNEANVESDVIEEVVETKIDIDYLTGMIREMSELISAELDVKSVLDYESVPKKGLFKNMRTDRFLLEYSGEIKAGIDLSKVSISELEKK